MDATEAGEAMAWPPELEVLYRERYVELVRLAYLLTGRRSVAEELTQDAFVAMRGRWSTVEHPGAYLRTTVVNRCRSWLRRLEVERRRDPPPPEAHELEADELWDALQRLPERRRTAIVLRFYEDLSDDRIAELLGCERATVRTTIHRGLAQLRQEIEP